ncbi:MAG: galactokinase [Clostridia bacterium]|nr:galactokinase [Clostridia bacterium]
MKLERKDLSFYPEDVLEYQMNRYERTANDFKAAFSYEAQAVFSAPGRSEICGNHTDHNLGKAVGASVNLDIIAFAAKRDDGKICIKANGFDDINVDIADLEMRDDEKNSSSALVRGVCRKFSDMGYKIGGFDAFTANDVLKGSGLSSSAAFEIMMAFILNSFYNDEKIDAKTMAVASQYAENVYFGKGSGLLDQLSCAYGGIISIDFEHPTAPVVERLPFDFTSTGYSMVITDTRCDHADLTGDYDAIKGEMQAVSRFFGKEHLRDVEYGEFFAALPKLKAKLPERAIIRAFHYFDENKNVEKLADALKQNAFDEFLSIVNRSGNSSYRYLQNIYSDKNPTSQGMSLAICLSEHLLGNKGASRVHGGGFGGTMQAYVPNDMVMDYVEKMESVFGDGCCYLLKIRSVGPVKVY